MTKEFHVDFNKICLDTDHSSVQMMVKELEGDNMILHFSKSQRVELLHQIQNYLYNTRQEYKKHMRKVKEEDEKREIDMRRKVNESVVERDNKKILEMLDRKNRKFEDEKQ